MKVTELRDQYLHWRTEQGFSPRTVANDKQAANGLVRAVGDLNIRTLTPLHIDQYLGSQAARGLSAASLNSLQSNLSAMFRYASERALIDPHKNPMLGRRYRRVQPKKRVRVPVQQFNQLLDAAANPRDRMIIAVGLFLLLRQGEAIALRIKDIDLDEGIVHTRISKTYEQDEMPITEELDRELRRWYTHYQAECGPLQPDWFLTPAMYPTGFQQFGLAPTKKITKSEDIIRRTLTRIGVTGTQIGMHTLRRSAARAVYSELEARGVDGALRRVAAWLHHASVRTTELYLGLDVDKATRNKEFRNMPLYPSLAADNVVELKRGENNGDQAHEAV